MVVRRSVRAVDIHRDEIIGELERLLASERFHRSPSLSRFLAYVVEHALTGDVEGLKEYTLGVEVFDRSESFDPRTDTIVRVQARRLRKRLEEYYADAGSDARLRIALPRGGYVPTFEIAAEPPSPAGGGQEEGGKPPRRFVWVRHGLLAAGLAAAAAAAVGIWNPPAGDADLPARMADRPLTAYPGYENHPALSPDGTQAAFVWDGEDRQGRDVYVAVIGGEMPIQVTDTVAEERHPAWSADGRRLAFLRLNDAGATVHIADLSDAGAERRIARVNIGGSGRSYGLDWSPDGRFLAAQNVEKADAPRGIFLISVETGESWRVTTPPAAYFEDRWPSFSPDGRSLAFVRGRTSHEVYTVALDEEGRPAGDAVQLTRESYYIRGVDWSPSGESVIFAGVTTGGRMQLRSVDVRSGETITLLDGRGAELPSAAKRAADSAVLLAYVRETDDTDLFAAPGPASPQDGTSHGPRKFASSTRYEHSPRFSADGTKIAFVSHRSGGSELWTANRDGSDPRRLTDFGARGGAAVGSPRWSPDGNFIAFDAGVDGHFDLFRINAAGGEPKRLTSDPSNEVRPSFSQDGQWMYFTSDSSGTPEIFKMPAEGGYPIRITKNGGQDAFESADGRWVYFAKRYGQFGEKGIFRIPVDGGREERVLEEGVVGKWALTPGGIYLYNPAGESGHPAIDFHPHDTLQPRMLLELPRTSQFGTANALTATQDDRTLVFVLKPEPGADLVLAEGGVDGR